MAKFNGVVALTQAEYDTLSSTGTLTVGSTTLTFDEYTLYLITDSPVVYTKDQVDALLAGYSPGDISALTNRVSALENAVLSLQTNKANTTDLPTMIDVNAGGGGGSIQYNTLPNGSQEAVYSGPVTINTLPNGSDEYILGGNN